VKPNYDNILNENILTVSGMVNVNGFTIEGSSCWCTQNRTRFPFRTVDTESRAWVERV